MRKIRELLQNFRDRLAHYDALPQLVVLGLLSGILTGFLMVLFRLAIELPLTYWLGHPDSFESLPQSQLFWWPLTGSLILIGIYFRWPALARQTGMVNMFERLAYHQGTIPGRSLIMQFVTATTALVSGHSVGREGPAIFLGAACSSLLGQRMRLPNNSIRLLIGCGTAAAISAAFNTPLAGVIFAMEVVLLEYTLIGFTPVIVAAVAADLVMRSTLGYENAFQVPSFEIGTLAEVPWIIALGVTVGLCSAFFNRLMIKTIAFTQWPVASRFLLAGVLTGIVATFYPQVMGVGYDTISESFQGNIEFTLLFGLLIAKLILTPIILGLGIPAGLIGPTLFIGALIGSIFGEVGSWFTDASMSHIGLYAMLGMGAMMGAVLNAPLAALVALLELTGNPNIIFPGMITIVISNLTVRFLFHMPSIFISSLQAQGLDYSQEPLAQVLSRAAVASLMDREFIATEPKTLPETAQQVLALKPRWLLLQNPNEKALSVMLPKNLSEYLSREAPTEAINLLEIPAERFDIIEVSYRATLYEALKKMDELRINVVCVISNQGDIMGMLTRSKIEYYYTHKQAL
ncbi:chloride channel protein [Neptunomonas phycophila]|uniref:chloride channel protein n=1 Tax=Neptunomonas TaxID=75687 RepID=UPI0009491BC5|nr:chloride channel protein [Neptunomonas phycophila]